ncbi:MAG TPA: hypothetical protein VHJ20_11435 [Polyangia bacterium]|nr:hypothetical protein [Polyangia bacterium]
MAVARERLTVDGSDALEASSWALLDEAAALVRAALPPGALRALVLIGGYGRGEGGVLVQGGVERPHNNFDLLAILERDLPAARAQLDDALAPLRRSSGIGIDVGLTTVARLVRSPALVMWVDMRNGHRLLAGDASFVPSLSRFTVTRIEPNDVRDLLVNRAALLAINDELEARFGAEADARLLLKHTVKAVIGYGDALLFVEGRYDSSYRERARRMENLDAAPAAFRRLYADAIAFRLRPAYEGPLARTFAARDELRAALEPIHAAFERRRLGPGQTSWDGHAHRSLRAELRVLEPARPAGALRALRTAARFRLPGLAPLDPFAHIGLRLGGARALLAATLPCVIYGSAGAAAASTAATLLGASGSASADLREAFLRLWGRWSDVNFGHVARKNGLVLAASSP